MVKIDASWYQKPETKISRRFAAGGIVVRKENDTIYIALILEGRFRDFSLPKGGIKTGEAPLVAARREILEEAGIAQLKKITYIGKRQRFNYTKTKWISVQYYLFTTTQKKAVPTDTSKKHVMKWFPIHQLPQMLWPEQRRLIEKNRERIEAVFVQNDGEQVQKEEKG